MPLSIMNAGGPANSLVRSLDSGWGRTLFSNILIRNIAQSLSKVGCLFGPHQLPEDLQFDKARAKVLQAKVLQAPLMLRMCCPSQDKTTLERQCRQNIPELKAASALEFGFKIRCCCVV